MSTNPSVTAGRRAARLRFLLILLVFTAPGVVAAWLVFAGYQPRGQAYGEPVLPQRNLLTEQVAVTLADGSSYAWRDKEPRLTLIALAAPGCASHCIEALTKMAAAWVTLNQNMGRLRLLYLGAPPADLVRDGVRNYWRLGQEAGHKLAAFVPRAPDNVSALLVESNGTVLAFYPAGFDPSGLRKDLQRVIH